MLAMLKETRQAEQRYIEQKYILLSRDRELTICQFHYYKLDELLLN